MPKHLPDPERTVTSTHRWTECGQYVDMREVVVGDEEANCPLCAVVAQARHASEKSDRIKRTFSSLTESQVWDKQKGKKKKE